MILKPLQDRTISYGKQVHKAASGHCVSISCVGRVRIEHRRYDGRCH